MSIKNNPLILLVEECINFRESAQEVLSVALGGETLSRLEGLVLLSVTESERPLTVPQVGRSLGHSRQVVQRAANHLVELGLVEKLPNPDHKTAALLKATERGEKFETTLGRALLDLVGSYLGEADLQTCERAFRDLRRLRGLLEDYRQGG